MAHQQIEHNFSFDFSLTDESGNAFEPVFGPGLTGLQNLGNRCAQILLPGNTRPIHCRQTTAVIWRP